MINQENPKGIVEYHILTKKIKNNPQNETKLQKGCIVLISPEMKPEEYVILIARNNLEHLSTLPIFYKDDRDGFFLLNELHKTALGMQGLQRLVCYCPKEKGLEESLGYITPQVGNLSEGSFQQYTGDFSLESANPATSLLTLRD